MEIIRLAFIFFVGIVFANEKELRQDLMQDYDKEVLPRKNTTVEIAFGIQHMDMNERLQFLELHLWLQMSWFDPRLTWSTNKYSSNAVMFKPDQIWVPDVTLYNNADAGNYNHLAKTQAHISNGSVQWVPPTTVAARCAVDTTYWPHDFHNCTAKFGSWVYNANMMSLQMSDSPFKSSTFYDEETKLLTFSEWRLKDIQLVRKETFYECCPEPYVTISMTVSLERVSPAYYWLVQIPAVGLSLLTVAVFMLPPTSGEKIFLGGIGLMANLFFLCSASHLIGHAPMYMPLILKLIVNQFILTLTSLIVCVHVLRLSKDPHSTGLPRIIRAPILTLSGFLCLANYRLMVSSSSKRDETAMIEGEGGRGLPEGGEGGKKEWLLLGAFVDRIFLVIYIIIFCINMIYFSGVL